jgi:hypothetical protein
MRGAASRDGPNDTVGLRFLAPIRQSTPDVASPPGVFWGAMPAASYPRQACEPLPDLVLTAEETVVLFRCLR